MEEVIKLNAVDQYNKMFGLETLHPLVSVVDLSEATGYPRHFTLNYGVYALSSKYQMRRYTLWKTVLRLPGRHGNQLRPGPGDRGQHAGRYAAQRLRPAVPPRLDKRHLAGTGNKAVFLLSYSSTEALHLSEDEKEIFLDCLKKIKMEIQRPIDKHSKGLIARNIELLLDYCMRFYERQFITRSAANKDILMKFEALIDDYFQSDKPQTEGLPSVKYFADKVFLSSNYFGDLVKKETGKTAQEYIQNKIIDLAKEMIIGSEKTVSQIAYELGYQYSQHFNRVFKKNVGYTPSEYRHLQV